MVFNKIKLKNLIWSTLKKKIKCLGQGGLAFLTYKKPGMWTYNF